MEPRHLDPLIRDIERSWTEEVRGTYCAPPRHAKTETVLVGIALTIARLPNETNVYSSYSATIARSKARKIRQYAEAIGVKFVDDASNMSESRTPQGGGLLATGVGGGLTGQGANRLFVDDPYKNRIDAESAAYRSRLIDWWSDVAETRIEPGGSVFVFHTRWHTDDLIGHIYAGESANRWTHHLMPAISDEGEPLWPERWSLEALREKEAAVGPYTWASLYQGQPRPRGGAVFGEPHFYEDRPGFDFQIAIGVDLAYTAKTLSDASVAVVMAKSGDKYFVLKVVRRQVTAPDFAVELKALHSEFPRARMRIYAAGTETGSVDFIKAQGVPLQALPPKGDKFVRATPFAAAWARGDVLLPTEDEWVGEYISELAVFTGLKDKRDDQVDASAAAFDLLEGSAHVKIDNPVARRRPGLGAF